MISFLLLILSGLSFSLSLPGSWSGVRRISEVHEFYPQGKTISEPRETWQHIASVHFLGESFREKKDCLFYFVPGEKSGRLKIKTVATEASCLDQILGPGDQEWGEISDLQFSKPPEGLKLSFTREKKDLVTWEILPPSFLPPEPKLHLSSAEFKGPRFVFLAPESGADPGAGESLKDGVSCHEVNDDCEAKGPATCELCENGWQEIPNGCSSGPKVCGSLPCGGKNLPACRRGMRYQRVEKSYDCRMDSSFAYCAPGLSVQCEGARAYCR